MFCFQFMLRPNAFAFFFSAISLPFLYHRYLTVFLVGMAEAALPLQPAGQRATVRQPGDVPHHPDGAG